MYYLRSNFLVLIIKKFLQNLKKVVSLQWQVLHNQLLLNPPGWERSKGRRS